MAIGPLGRMIILEKHGFVQVDGVWVKPSKSSPGWTWNVTVNDHEPDYAILKDQYGREQGKQIFNYVW